MKNPLVRLLVALLTLLLRLIVLLVTGQWVKFEKPEAEASPSALPNPPSAAANVAREHARAERAELNARLQELEAQQPPEDRVHLAHFARTTQHFYADVEAHFRDHGLPLRRRSFVALSTVSEPDLALFSQIAEHTKRVPFCVPRSAFDGFAGYVFGLRARTETFADDTRLIARLRGHLGLPPLRALPGHVEKAPEALLVRLAFGVWLRPLVADMLLSLRLGPGYTRFLLHEAQGRSDGISKGPWGTPEPPIRLRLEAALHSLFQSGEFESEAANLESEIRALMGQAPALRVELGDAGALRPVSVSFPAWRAQLETLIETVFHEPFPGAGGLSLLDFEGVTHSRDRAAALAQASQVNGEPSNTDVGDLLASAFDARMDPVTESQVLRRLHEKLGGSPRSSARARRVSEKKTDLPPEPRAEEESLQAALRSPYVWRDAVIFGAVLGPRAALSRGRSGKSGPA